MDKDDASFLLSVVGIANTIGRIVLGFLSDKQWINRLYLYNFSLAGCGIGKYLHQSPHLMIVGVMVFLVSIGRK